MQYSYYHDNPMVACNTSNKYCAAAPTFLFFMHNGTTGSNPTWGNNQFRYNIAENNAKGYAVNNSTGLPLSTNSIAFYNNTVVSNLSFNPAVLSTSNERGSCWSMTQNTVNNLCILTSTSGTQYYTNQYCPGTFGGNPGIEDYNAYWGLATAP